MGSLLLNAVLASSLNLIFNSLVLLLAEQLAIVEFIEQCKFLLHLLSGRHADVLLSHLVDRLQELLLLCLLLPDGLLLIFNLGSVGSLWR